MLFNVSIKKQTIIIILLVTSLCIAVMGWLVYFLSIKQIKHEVQQAYHVSLLRTKDRMESYFRQIDQSINQFEKMPAVQKLLSFQRAEEAAPLEIIGVPDMLLRMQATIDYVDNLALYQTDQRKILFSTNIAMTDHHEEYKAIIAEFERLGKDFALMNMTMKSSPVMIYIRKLPLFYSTRTGYILFHINQKFYNEMLGNDDLAGEGNYFILDRDRNLIKNRGSLDDDLIRTDIAPHLQYDAQPQGRSPGMPGGDYFVIHLEPSFSGWIYGFAVPNRILVKNMAVLRNIIFVVAGALVFIACLVIIVSTNRLWRRWGKITQLLDESVEPQAIASPGDSRRTDELDQIYIKVRHITTNWDDLKAQVRGLIPELRETFIRHILEHGVRDNDRDKFKKYDISLCEGLYCCLCIEIDRFNSMTSLYSEVEIYYFHYALSNVANEVLQGKGKGFAVHAGHGRQHCLLTTDTWQSDEALQAANDCALTIRDFVNRFFPFTVSIGISGVRKDIAHLNLSSQEAADALKHKLVAGTNQLIASSRECSEEAVDLPFSFQELENNLVHAIRAQNQTMAYELIDQIYSLQGLPAVNYQWVQNQLMDMIYFVFRSFGEVHQHSLPEPAIGELMQFSSLDEWIDWIRNNVIDVLIADTRQKQREHMEKICARIGQYVQAHLEEDLRLEVCCKQLSIPLRIAKQALKEIENTTFFEYVLQARIRLAKKWLIETEQSIDDIAIKLYYSNAQNFSRTFKKAVGVPPGQYRREHR